MMIRTVEKKDIGTLGEAKILAERWRREYNHI
jgi:hypothetical protein